MKNSEEEEIGLRYFVCRKDVWLEIIHRTQRREKAFRLEREDRAV